MVDLPRVPNERAGCCRRAGLLGQGLGALANICQQYPMWQSGSFAHCWARWGQFWAGNSVFGKE